MVVKPYPEVYSKVILFFHSNAPSRSEGPYNERKNNMRMELKTKNKTKVEGAF